MPSVSLEALFPPLPVPEELMLAAKAKGWPEGLIQRVVDVRPAGWRLQEWLEGDAAAGAVQTEVETQERLLFGTLRSRKATVSDADGFADLWANSPEHIGDWEVTVERSPDPFAQWRLQENVIINVLEDRGLILASQVNSRRNALVDGQKVTVSLPQGVRVRKEFRRLGYSQLVTGGGGGPHPNSPVDTAAYFYVRSQNFSSYEWMKATHPGSFDHAPPQADEVPGLPVWVDLLTATPYEGDVTGIRPVADQDVARCASLINRTHRGLDLFRPWSAESLALRLDEGWWGPKTDWSPPVYGWPDHHVLEQDGRVVACAGLWDRGRDIREVWRREDGEERVAAATALMDFGFARGHEAELARLIEYLMGISAELNRDYVMAPLQFLPTLARRLRHLRSAQDKRVMVWNAWGGQAPEMKRPYTDLGYW